MLPFPWPCTPKPSLWLSSKTWPCVRFQCESCLSTQKEEDRSRPVIAQEQTGQCVCFSQRCQSEHALCLGIPSAGVAPAHNTFTHSSLSNSKSSADNSPGLWGGVYLESPKKWRTCDREEIFHKWAANSACDHLDANRRVTSDKPHIHPPCGVACSRQEMDHLSDTRSST